ncbi:MAG: hypothetical protein EXR98_14455 [Gemmataceae bacterium]|nr:hypothetical protein [Gemmataceae bacterium]
MRTTLAAAILTLTFVSAAQAQPDITATLASDDSITPKFVPVKKGSAKSVQTAPAKPANAITPITFVQPMPALQPRKLGAPEDSAEVYVRLELPGPQRLFTRESESQFFERLAQDIRKTPGARAIFPEEPSISKVTLTQMPFPRVDPITKKTYAFQQTTVEPCYVYHGRLYFEQPNFERTGWNFGVLQPAISLGVFYYDLALLPYHVCSDLQRGAECSAGKCLPGDPAPLLLPRERFSVTGLVGQTSVILGGYYLFP